MKPATSNRVRTYRSHGHIWQLWINGRGERSIEHWDRDGNHQTVAYMKTARVNHKGISGYYKTLVSWNLYQYRWNTKLGNYKSDAAAFDAFTKGM